MCGDWIALFIDIARTIGEAAEITHENLLNEQRVVDDEYWLVSEVTTNEFVMLKFLVKVEECVGEALAEQEQIAEISKQKLCRHLRESMTRPVVEEVLVQ